MKREGNLYEKLISDENLRRALGAVNHTHKWLRGHRRNRVVARVEADMDGHVEKLRQIIEQGFEQTQATTKKLWDSCSGKWRDIYEPKLWPDQYVHHALIQTLEPVMMRGMDPWCCGSIPGRGVHYGARAIKKWMKNDRKGTKWCAELDIRHFYENLKPEVVMARMRQLVKDRRVLDLVERTLRDGVLIGSYCSQWYANVVLQPIDHALREKGLGVRHYLRYLDNFTLFAKNKRSLRRAVETVKGMLRELGLELKGNYQRFRTEDRLPTALGFRYGQGYTLLRKRNLLRLKRQLRTYYKRADIGAWVPHGLASGLLSRLGQLKHCSTTRLRQRLVRKGTIRQLKQIVRAYTRRTRALWAARSTEAA